MRTSQILLAALFLSGCIHLPTSVIPLDGADAGDLSRVSLLAEDEDFPLLLRAVDGVSVESGKPGRVLGKRVYAVSPGNHRLRVKGMPYAIPLLPQRIRCYEIEVELAQGARYVLREDVGAKRALLLTADTGTVEATGRLIDEPWIFERDCKWE